MQLVSECGRFFIIGVIIQLCSFLPCLAAIWQSGRFIKRARSRCSERRCTDGEATILMRFIPPDPIMCSTKRRRAPAQIRGTPYVNVSLTSVSN